MAKLNISRLFETSRYAATEAGKQLSDMLDYLQQFTTEVVRNLRSGLTFVDNFLAESKEVNLTSGVATVIRPGKLQKASQILIGKITDSNYYVVESFGWTYNGSGDLVVKMTFAGSPPANYSVPVTLIILY